jgi:hypothetical protein
MDRKFYVYKLQLKGELNPFYIGKGTGDRLYCHLQKSSIKLNSPKNEVIIAALADDVKVLSIVLHTDLTNEESLFLEKFEISKLGILSSGGILTNQTLGGGGTAGWKHTESHKLNMSRIQKGKPADPAVVKRMRETLVEGYRSGKYKEQIENARNRMIGSSPSTETLEKQRLSKTGKVHTREHRENISNGLIGKKHDDIRRGRNSRGQWAKNACWMEAANIYQTWMELMQKNEYALSRITGHPVSKIANMVKRFKSGWIPLQDQNWIDYTKGLL